ncbi:MAG: carboxypeptidase-like regulatory domain-containing protein [Bacteroidota bacterium]
MKKKNFLAIAFMFMAVVALTFTSCTDNGENGDDTFTVTFVIQDENGNAVENAVVTFMDVVKDDGNYVYEDVATGVYNYTVEAPGFLTTEESVTVSEDVTVTVILAESGIVGTWVSEGDNVAPLLAEYLDIVKIDAEFRTDGTYTVYSYTSEEVETVFEGIYTQNKTTYGQIWEITLEQTVPSAVTSEGIFEITVNPAGGPRTMMYEVVQTNPSLGTAPTAAEGFGSSSGGTLGDTNIQHYVEVVE